MKNSVLTFKKAKEEGTRLTMLTAYDYSTAKLIDEAGVNSILVGDSLGNVMLGYEDTLSVTMKIQLQFRKPEHLLSYLNAYLQSLPPLLQKNFLYLQSE